MDITVHFTAQLKQELGVAVDQVSLQEVANTFELVEWLVKRYGQRFESFALDGSGRLLPSIVLCINGAQVTRAEPHTLRAKDEIHLVSAISGG